MVEANLGLAALAQGRTSNAIDALCGAVDRARACRKRDSILARACARAGRRNEASREARMLLSQLPAGAPQRAEVERLVRAIEGSR